jgi:hypothetical protein
MQNITTAGDRALILLSNRTENSLGSLLSESLAGIGVIATVAGVMKSADAAIEAARGVDCLIGMPTELLYMSRKAPCLAPGSVLLADDIVPRSVIRSIAETWQCEVFTHYGHKEFGYGCAVDCSAHDGLHLRDADFLTEIVDPATDLPSSPGELREIVITTLSNEAMPVIRYSTGKLFALDQQTLQMRQFAATPR